MDNVPATRPIDMAELQVPSYPFVSLPDRQSQKADETIDLEAGIHEETLLPGEDEQIPDADDFNTSFHSIRSEQFSEAEEGLSETEEGNKQLTGASSLITESAQPSGRRAYITADRAISAQSEDVLLPRLRSQWK